TANDVDVDGDPFTLTSVLGGVNSAVVIDGDDAVFTPRYGYSGDAAFLYTVTDDHGAVGFGTVNLEVLPTYHLPIAVSDSGFTMEQDTTLDIDPASLLANDIDPDGNPLTFLGFTDGPVTLLENGFYRVTPEFNFTGPLVLTYSIENGGHIPVSTTVTIDVQHVEHNPTAVDDAFTMVDDQPIRLTPRD